MELLEHRPRKLWATTTIVVGALAAAVVCLERVDKEARDEAETARVVVDHERTQIVAGHRSRELQEPCFENRGRAAAGARVSVL